ncbi:SufD family Fe-S cluster assembly protein [Vallitalea okinawensis]|uniref:SufD family Fe-S cluster assembly protein n=1 Tax=Vallitalea okinawensis TaxID=2078660 RepID=UPI000CFB29CE|nr:SufD family Fe-S cluster assembly protein [Vallitalea okinawensis]
MLKWKRIKINDISFPSHVTYTDHYVDSPYAKQVLKVLTTNESLVPIKEGVDRELIAHNEENLNAGVHINLDNQQLDAPIQIEFNLNQDNPILIDRHTIQVRNGSTATIIFNYSTIDDIEAFHNGVTTVECDENSSVKIIKLYRFNASSYNFDSNYSFAGKDSSIEYITIDLTEGLSATSYINELVASSANVVHKEIYFAKGESRHDHHYKMLHRAPYGNSKIDIRGAMMDQARKVFRGTIDFKKGSGKSKASEKEYVLLLNEGLASHAIPALLCDEDDVEGEHAASAGQIDEGQLFYLMSRGFSLVDAKRLLVESNFRPIIEALPDEDIRESVLQSVLEGLTI